MHPSKHVYCGLLTLLALFNVSLGQDGAVDFCTHHIIVHGNSTEIIKSALHAVDCILQLSAYHTFDYGIKYLPSSNTNITSTFNRAAHYIKATGPLSGDGQKLYDTYFKANISSLNQDCFYWRQGIQEDRSELGPAGLNCSELAAASEQLTAVNTLMNGFGSVFNSSLADKMANKLKPCWNEFDKLNIYLNQNVRPYSKCN